MKNILYKKLDKICSIQANRPEKYNALNLNTINQLQEAVESAIKDPEIRVVILMSNEADGLVIPMPTLPPFGFNNSFL